MLTCPHVLIVSCGHDVFSVVVLSASPSTESAPFCRCHGFCMNGSAKHHASGHSFRYHPFRARGCLCFALALWCSTAPGCRLSSALFCCSSGIVLGLNQLMRGQVVKRFSSLIDCVGALQSLWFVIIFFAYISCGGDVLHWMNNRLRRNNMTRKVTGPKAASSASKTLSSGSTGVKSKTAAASALSQTKAPAKQTSASAASAASKTLSDGRSSKASKSAAGSTLSQRAGKKK